MRMARGTTSDPGEVADLEIGPSLHSGWTAPAAARRREVPWAAAVISLLGLAAAVVGARVTQMPTGTSPASVTASPVATDAQVNDGVATGEWPPETAAPVVVGTATPTAITPSMPARVTLTPIRTTPANSGTGASSGAPSPSSSSGGAGGGAGVGPAPQPSAPTTTWCRFSSSVQSSWNSGFVAQFTITNTSGSTVSGWSAGFTVRPGIRSVQQSWGATVTGGAGGLQAVPFGYNVSIAPGHSVSFGFQAATDGSYPRFASLVVDGLPCSG